MLRDNTAHLPAIPANDTRDTPLNRLLRKPSPAPDAPVGAPPSTQATAAAALTTKPLDTQASAPGSTLAKPPAAQVSPAEMLVNKLRDKQMPAQLPSADKPVNTEASVPETLVGKPIDVEFTPVEAPAGKLLGAADATGEAAVGKPVPARDSAPERTAAQPPLVHEAPAAPHPAPIPAAEAPASAEPPVQSSVLEMPVEKLLPTSGPAPERSFEQPVSAPRLSTEIPVAKPSPAQSPAPEMPAAKPLPPQVPAQEALFDKPPLGPISSPEAPAEKTLRRPGTALEKSIGRLLPEQDSAAEKSVAKMLAIPRRTRDEREFLPAALEIVDTPPSPVGRAIGLTIIAVAVLAIAWACIGKVDIVATAGGRIVPQGKSKIVQPVDTGIVTAIHVADGDHVKAGDPLIELNSNQVTADRDRFQRDLLQANLNLARLRGLAATLPGTPGEGRAPDLVDPPSDANPEDLTLTLAAMRAQAANENAKLADLDQQVEAKQAEAAEAAAATEKLQASLPMVADQEKILRAMRDQKVGSKLDWYQVNQQLIEQQHEISVLAHRKDAAAAAQRALREQRAAEAAQYQMSVLADLDKMRAQASELEAELAKAQQRLSQVVLHAPIAGTVQQLAVHTIGGVVTPAEALLTIVPDEGGLVVEAAVRNRDVGFIRAGQTVRVKVEAFNFTLYGLINGEVLDVTRDAVSHSNEKKGNSADDQNDGSNVASDDNSGPVYLARIALSQDWMMTENGKVPLAPGMAVTAEIQTGERRLISYLLSPLVRHVSESMHER